MTRTAVVDAHALLWFLDDSPKLSAQADAIMSDPNSRLLLPAVALDEACWAIARSKGNIGITVAELRQALSDDRRFTVVSLDEDLVYEAHSLTGDLEIA